MKEKLGRPVLMEFCNSKKDITLSNKPEPSATDPHLLAVIMKKSDSDSIPEVPTFVDGTENISLMRVFKFQTWPRYVLVDEQGKIIAIGGSPLISHHLKRNNN